MCGSNIEPLALLLTHYPLACLISQLFLVLDRGKTRSFLGLFQGRLMRESKCQFGFSLCDVMPTWMCVHTWKIMDFLLLTHTSPPFKMMNPVFVPT